MNLYVVRHGEADYNTKGLSNADPTVENNLTETGIQQAEQLAEKLRGVQFDQVYTSEFPRTKQTAEIINKFHAAPKKTHALINELRIGMEVEGKPVQEWNELRNQANDMWSFKLRNAESMADGYARTKKFIEYLKQQQHENVLIVTHGFIVLVLRALLEGYPIKEEYEKGDPGATASHSVVAKLTL